MPEVHNFECTSHEMYQYGHETNAALQWVHTYFGAVHLTRTQHILFFKEATWRTLVHLHILFVINIILVSPTNHKSLQAEHGIKSLSGLLVKHLSEQCNWVSCLSYSSLCYNCYDSPNLDGHSPYELVFGHKNLRYSQKWL